MKEYCLVPIDIARKYMFDTPPKEIEPILPPTLPYSSKKPPPRTNPPLTELIKIGVAPHLREYGFSLVKMMEGKSNIEWDEHGNLFPPFGSLNVIDVINTAGNTKGRFPNDHKSLISLLFRLSEVPPTVVRNPSQKKHIFGGWRPY